MPVLLLVLMLCLGALAAVSQQLRLADESSAAARLVSRGEDPEVALRRIRRSSPSGTVAIEKDGQFVCVRAEAPAEAPGLRSTGIVLRARACALDAGW
jgi:hypothetical protein